MRNMVILGIALILAPATGAAAQETLWTYRAPSGYLDASPAVADLDGDGEMDVVVATTVGGVLALDGNGRLLWQKMCDGAISIAPTALDVTGDPYPEVLVLNNYGVLYCIDGRSGDAVWERQLPRSITWGMTAVAAHDLEGDGEVDIVTGDEGGTVVCIAGDGRLRWRYIGEQGATMCPAIDDLGFGPEAEIIVSGTSGRVICLSHEGEVRWEYEGLGPASSPVIADIDGDEQNEVVVALGQSLTALDRAGALLWTTPLKREVDSALTVVDVDGDGKSEVYAIDLSAYMVCVAGDGTVRWTADVEERVRRSPSVADVDGDGMLEVLVAGYSSAIHVFTSDGYLKQRVPLSGPSNATATVAGLGGDGTPVVLCTTAAGLLTAIQWPGAQRAAAVLWPEYRFNASRTGAPGSEAGAPTVRIVQFEEGDCHVGANVFRIAVDNTDNVDISIELDISLNDRPLAHKVFAGQDGQHAYEASYILDGRETANLRFVAKAVSDEKVLAQRSRAFFVVPFRKELADLEAAFESMDSRLTEVADPSGLEDRVYFLQRRLPDLTKRIDRAGTISDVDRRALRDELAGLLGEVRRLHSLVSHAAELTAEGHGIVVSSANPWAPFGALDEIIEERLTAPSLAVEAFDGENEVAALNLFNLAGDLVYARVEAAPFRREGAGEESEVPARDVVRLHEVLPVPSQMMDLAADAVPALNQGNVLVLPAWDGRQLWLDIDTQPLSPGTWASELRIRTLAVDPVEIIVPIQVLVWDMALPDEQALKLCHWGYVHSSILKDQADAALQDQIELGTNVFVGLFAPQATFDEHGDLVGEIDFSRHDAYVRRHAPHGTILFCGYQSALKGPAKPGEPAYKTAHVAWLRAWVKHLAELGVQYDGFALYPVDEPGLRKGLVEAYIQMAELAREADPNIRMYTDPVGRITLEELARMDPLVDIWCPNRNGLLLHYGTEKLDFILSTGSTVWTYECDANVKHESPLGYYRAQAWLAWHYGMTGIGFWSYCTARDDPWFAPESGAEYLLIYQGNGVVRSKRWFGIRDGIEDYSMLVALRDSVAHASAQNQHPDATARAEKLLGEQASAIARFCGLDEDGTTPSRHGLPDTRRLADSRWEAFKSIRRDMAKLLTALSVE